MFGYKGKAGDAAQRRRRPVSGSSGATSTVTRSTCRVVDHEPAAEPDRHHALPQAAPVWTTINAAAGELHLEDGPRDGDPEPGHQHRRRAVPRRHRHGDGDRDRRTGASVASGGADPSPSARRRCRRRWRRWARSRRRTSPPQGRTRRRAAGAAQDQTCSGNLTTVVGAWGIADTRKGTQQRLGQRHHAEQRHRWRGRQARAGGLLRRPAGWLVSARTVTANAVKSTAPRPRSASRSPTPPGARRPAPSRWSSRGRRDGRIRHRRGRGRRGVLHAAGDPGPGHVRVHALLPG